MEAKKFEVKLQTGGFHQELKELINRHGVDSDLDTPEYVLAFYVIDCLCNYNRLKRLIKQHENLLALNDSG